MSQKQRVFLVLTNWTQRENGQISSPFPPSYPLSPHVSGESLTVTCDGSFAGSRCLWGIFCILGGVELLEKERTGACGSGKDLERIE